MTSQRRVFWRDFFSSSMVEQLNAEDLSLLIVERATSFILYASDHVGLEICARTARKLEDHTRMLISISMPGSVSEIFTKFPLKDSSEL